ncbi:bifunctional DNA primase/polymerase [Ruegeria sp. HKCCA5426]|uniref:bifunctional DNA primase/polymerase n=1 Tax=Ruegeria sp. HKCCA5426 TaxID=2682985 RepID=UPI001487A2BD|nr:bifunctional DNA primase/polymerase [Ruegeria sp. HKCCA5426]
MAEFSKHALSLHCGGWRPIPIRYRSKAPSITGWQWLNVSPWRDKDLTQALLVHAHCGVATAVSKDMLVVDLDADDPDLATTLRGKAEEVFGRSPLRRTGRPPRVSMFYRAADDLNLGKVVLPQVELFNGSGYCILAGIHPDTGRGYRWEFAKPWQTHLRHRSVPVVTKAQVEAFRQWVEANVEGKPGQRVATGDGTGNVMRDTLQQYIRAAFTPELGVENFLGAECFEGQRHNSVFAAAVWAKGQNMAEEDFLDLVLRWAADAPPVDEILTVFNSVTPAAQRKLSKPFVPLKLTARSLALANNPNNRK